MSFPHRESTKILLGPVEAYAAAHRRTMKVVNSAAALSLNVANGLRNDTALRSLREGDTIVPSDLEAIIPGLADVQWTFDDSTNHYELWTVIDDLIVTLSVDRATESSPFLAEGSLRGLAARLVMAMTYP